MPLNSLTQPFLYVQFWKEQSSKRGQWVLWGGRCMKAAEGDGGDLQ